jgi:hypothetical protein
MRMLEGLCYGTTQGVHRGQPLTSTRPAVDAKPLDVNKLLLLGHKLKPFFPTLGTFIAKEIMYNPDTDPYHQVYPTDDHEG